MKGRSMKYLVVLLSVFWVVPVWAEKIQQEGVIALSSGSYPEGHGGYEIDLCVNTNTEAGEICGDPNPELDVECSNPNFTTRNKWVLDWQHPHFEGLVDQLEWAFGHSWKVVIIGQRCEPGSLYSTIEQIRVSNYKPLGFFVTNQ